MAFSARRLLATSGWLVAPILVVLYLGSRYEVPSGSAVAQTKTDRELTLNTLANLEYRVNLGGAGQGQRIKLTNGQKTSTSGWTKSMWPSVI
jgi:hypothetical protein